MVSMKRIPDKLELPLKSEAGRWRLTRRDWIAPVALTVTMFVTLAIEQVLAAINNDEQISWFMIVVVPSLLVIRNLLHNGLRADVPADPPGTFPESGPYDD
jgi:hypothetical protein